MAKKVRYDGQQLTTSQIMTLRSLVEPHEDDPPPTPNTLASLKRRGLVDDNGKPTTQGTRWVKGYVERTGDGPELLKEFFRF